MNKYKKLDNYYSSEHLVFRCCYHVHIIINCNPRYIIMKCIQVIKSATALRLFEEFPSIKKRYLWGGKFWSRSSFVATVGSVSLEVVKKYIENQGM